MANLRPEIFRPSSAVRLTVRFEEYDDTGALAERLAPVAVGSPAPVPTPEAPQVQHDAPLGRDETLRRIASLDDQIERADPSASEGIIVNGIVTGWRNVRRSLRHRRARLVASLGGEPTATSSPTTSTSPPESIGGPSPDDRRHTIALVPISVEIERNGLRTADTATIVFDYSDLPTDARLIRSASVEIVLGIVDPADYVRGMSGERRVSVGRSTEVEIGALFSLIESGSPNATRFVGVVDDWKTTLDETNGDTIEITCRDLSALALDTPMVGTGIDLTVPLDEGIQAFLRQYPTFGPALGRDGIKVFYGRPGQTGTAPTPADTAPRATRPRRGRGARAQRQGDQNTNLWDHITDVCVRAGLVPLFYDYDLRIIDPRTFYSPRDVPVRVVYGRNLRHFEVTRRLGGVLVPTIEVRCYDPDIGRTRWARYPVPTGAEATASAGIFGQSNPPQRPTRPNEVSVSGWAPDERIQTIIVQGVTDPETLRRVARSSFEQIGRQEIEGNFQTDVPRSVSPEDRTRGGESARAVAIDAMDLLHLTSGDAVEVLITGGIRAPREQLAGLTTAQLAALSRAAREDYLVSIGWERRVAAAFARVADAVAFQTVFRTQNVRLEFDQEEGFTLNVDFINFIVVREEAQTNPDSGTAGELPVRVVTLDELHVGRRRRVVLDELRIERDVIQQQRGDSTISQDQYQERLAAVDEAVETQPEDT